MKKTIKIILRLDNRTHNALINLTNGCLPVKLMLKKRCIKFIWNRFISPDEIQKSVVNTLFFTLEDLLLQK